MRTWKLYRVSTPFPIEDCFVVARTSRQAASLEENESGFDPGDATAELVINIPHEIEKQFLKAHLASLKVNDKSDKAETKSDHCWPDYAHPDLLTKLGAEFTIENGREVTSIAGISFPPTAVEEAYCHREPPIIRQISDLISRVSSNGPATWLYRGQSDAAWEVQCGLERDACRKNWIESNRVQYELRILSQFKLRARPYLRIVPQNDWEWLVLAQHHGLPTRLLD